jgi:hypothetical protein
MRERIGDKKTDGSKTDNRNLRGAVRQEEKSYQKMAG